MSRKSTLAPVAAALACAGLAVTATAQAAENPFGMTDLGAGYMVADHNEGHGKMMKEGKCGEGKCGEGKCGGMSSKDMKEGKCGEGMKKEGDKAMKEGKCGEGKCGGMEKK